MKLKEHKLRMKEDFNVFRTFLRCMKEHGLYKRFSGYNDMIGRCYNSRDCHRGENFLTNIGFWPADAGSAISKPEIRILYMSMIINSLPMEIILSSKKGQSNIVENLKSLFINFSINQAAFSVKSGYLDIVISALSKCFKASNEKEINDIIYLVLKGKELGIPF